MNILFLLLNVLVVYHVNCQCILNTKEYALIEKKLLENMRQPLLQLIQVFLGKTQQQMDKVEHLISETQRNQRETCDSLSKQTQAFFLSSNQTQQSLKAAHKALSDQMSDLNTKLATLNQTVVNLCPSGWVKFRTKCYRAENTPASFNDAKAKCGLFGAKLSVPMNSDENTFIARLTKDDSWIGVKANSHRVFVDADSKQPITYSRWYRGEPNNYRGNQFCVQTNYKGVGYWDDANCNDKAEYSCQMSL